MSLRNKKSFLSPQDSTSSAPEIPSELSGPYKYKSKPIAELKTNLAELKFNNTKAGSAQAGSTSQPYIESPIDPGGNKNIKTPLSIQTATYYESNRTSKDRNANAKVVSTLVDSKRIKKFLEDKPVGDSFVRKQKDLQLMNPKMETSGMLLQNIQNQSPFDKSSNQIPGVLENIRTFNPENLLKQVASGGAGKSPSFLRHGDKPTSKAQGYYNDTVSKQNQAAQNLDTPELERSNRLLALKKTKLENQNPNIYLGNQKQANDLKNLGISTNRFTLLDYPGGPQSAQGLGNTQIARSVDTNVKLVTNSYTSLAKDVNGVNVPVRRAHNSLSNSFLAYTYEKIANMPANPNKNIYDSHQFYDPTPIQTRETILNTAGDYPASLQSGAPTFDTDLIKFGFECMSNDSPGTSTFLQFRALLTNGINDSNQANYNTYKYAGRGEDFFTYQGFTRTITFGFRIIINNGDKLPGVYSKLNSLMSQVYPDYSANGYMRSALVRLTIGDYVYRMPGFLDSVNVTVDQDNSWGVGGEIQLPRYITVDIVFKPIMEMIPQRHLLDKPGGGLIVNGIINPPLMAAAAASQAQLDSAEAAAAQAKADAAMAAQRAAADKAAADKAAAAAAAAKNKAVTSKSQPQVAVENQQVVDNRVNLGTIRTDNTTVSSGNASYLQQKASQLYTQPSTITVNGVNTGLPNYNTLSPAEKAAIQRQSQQTVKPG